MIHFISHDIHIILCIYRWFHTAPRCSACTMLLRVDAHSHIIRHLCLVVVKLYNLFELMLFRRIIFYRLLVNLFYSLVVMSAPCCHDLCKTSFTWFQAHLCVSLFDLSYYFSADCEFNFSCRPNQWSKSLSLIQNNEFDNYLALLSFDCISFMLAKTVREQASINTSS